MGRCVQGAGERDGLSYVVEAAESRLRRARCPSRSRCGGRCRSGGGQVPLEGFPGQLVLSMRLLNNYNLTRAGPANDFAVTFRSQDVDAEGEVWR